MNARTVAVNPRELVFSPWNVNVVSPDNQKKLVESIRRNGIFRPVVVRETPDGNLEVIAGEHTTRASITLGMKTIDVYNLGAISDVRAKEISVIDNQHYGAEDTFGLASLLREIDADPATFLPFTDDDLTKIFEATDIDLDGLGFDDDEESDGDKPEEQLASAPVTHQIMRFTVPISDAEHVTRCIETIIRRQKLSARDPQENAGDALVYMCRNWGKSE